MTGKRTSGVQERTYVSENIVNSLLIIVINMLAQVLEKGCQRVI
jgi:hypothetical protein